MTVLAVRPASVSSRPAAHRTIVALLITVYTLVLAAVYEFIISPRFSYSGFVSVHPDPLYLVRDALLCGVLAFFLPRSVVRASDLGRIVVFFLVIVPTVVIPTFLNDQGDSKVIETKAYGVVAFLVLTAVLAAIPRDAVRLLRLPGNHALYILVALAVVAVLVLGLSYGFSIQIHPLSDVYDQREVYFEGGGGRSIIGFAAGLLQNALAPIFLVVGMRRRSVLSFAFGLMLLIYVYSITGLRSAIIGAGFVVGFYVFASIVKAAAFTWAWTAAVIAFVSAAALVSSIPVLSIGVDLIVRRVLTMGGMLNYNYVKIFGREEPTYFSHTILGTFWQRTLRETPQDIVGEQLVGRAVGANGSFIADGYVSGKLLGVLFATVVVAFYLALLDAMSSELPPPVALASTSMVIFIMTQTSVVTALLNLGGIALAACLWLAGSALAVGRRPTNAQRCRRSAMFRYRQRFLYRAPHDHDHRRTRFPTIHHVDPGSNA